MINNVINVETFITGLLCDYNTDECESSPCQNSATCIDEINSYTCQCASGFTGELTKKCMPTMSIIH